VQPDIVIPNNIASPKVEKEYDDSVLRRRLKIIESFLQSKIHWVLDDFKREDDLHPTGMNGKDDVDDDILHPPAMKRRKDKDSGRRDDVDKGSVDDNDKSKVSYLDSVVTYDCLYRSVSIFLLESVYVC